MAQRIDRAASFGQNLYVDTRGAAGEPVPFTQAVINGLAQGGGSLRSRRAADAEP